MQIELVLSPTPEDYKVVVEGLVAFNEAAGGPAKHQALCVALRDDDGKMIGGLIGGSGYDWLHIELLHVPDAARGQGLGTQLMQRAEEFARERGLAGIWLDTFNFQALGFYERLGFTVFGTLEDHPIGGRRFFLEKRFAAPATSN
jgi:ribosomal protein S18 acetylase RimI-like enzyme